MTGTELDERIELTVQALRREHAEDGLADWADALCRRHYWRLVGDATVIDFIPLLVYRYTREELKRTAPDGQHHSA